LPSFKAAFLFFFGQFDNSGSGFLEDSFLGSFFSSSLGLERFLSCDGPFDECSKTMRFLKKPVLL